MMITGKITKYLRLYGQASCVINADVPWEIKYRLIFSDEISRRMHSLLPLDGYCDLDMGYEDDVMAWFIAATRQAEHLRVVAQALGSEPQEEGA